MTVAFSPSVRSVRRFSILAMIVGALVLGSVQPAFAASAYPRLAVWWPDPTTQSAADIGRYDWIGLHPWHSESIPAIRAANPNIVILGDNSATELNFREDSYNDPLNVELRSASLKWLLTQAGSTLAAAVGPSDSTVSVAQTTRSGATLFAVGDVLVVDNELFKVTAVNGLDLTVKRGTAMGMPAASHAAGTRIAAVCSSWPGALTMDVTTNCPLADVGYGLERWEDWNVRRLQTRLHSADYDGIIIDCMYPTVSWVVRPGLGNPIRSIDESRTNAIPTSYTALDDAWAKGTAAYAASVRTLVGPGPIIVGNNAGPNLTDVNGAIFEDYPYDGITLAHWQKHFVGPCPPESGYLAWNAGRQPNFALVETYESDGWLSSNPFGTPGWNPNYRKMRFGLTSALMGDGSFSYEMASNGHGGRGLMWFDEYDNAGACKGYLGQPLGAASASGGVYRRDFQGGIALVNPSDVTVTVTLGGTFRKIRGTQAPTVNDGSLVTAVTIPAKDGLVLLRPAPATAPAEPTSTPPADPTTPTPPADPTTTTPPASEPPTTTTTTPPPASNPTPVPTPTPTTLAITSADFTNPVAYDIKSLLTTKMSMTCSVSGVRATLVVHVPGGDWTVFNGNIANTAGVPYTFPAWNGRNPATGKRAPYAANYGWTLTVTKNGQTATKTGSLLLSKIYYQAKGTSVGGHAVLVKCYLKGSVARPGGVNFYISASSSAASDQLALRITRAGGYAVASSSMPWRLPAPRPAPKTPTVSGRSGIKVNGIHNIYLTGKTNVTYMVSVIE